MHVKQATERKNPATGNEPKIPETEKIVTQIAC